MKGQNVSGAKIAVQGNTESEIHIQSFYLYCNRGGGKVSEVTVQAEKRTEEGVERRVMWGVSKEKGRMKVIEESNSVWMW